MPFYALYLNALAKSRLVGRRLLESERWDGRHTRFAYFVNALTKIPPGPSVGALLESEQWGWIGHVARVKNIAYNETPTL